jgi:hypothetical protein
VSPVHAWYRDLVSTMLSLGSCYQKGSLEVMDISVGWPTEEWGFGNRRGHVFIISTVCRPAPGPTLLWVPKGKAVGREFCVCHF